MPYLAITTNASLTPEAESALVAAASKCLSAELGKPEAYVMVSLQRVPTMSFAGSGEPTAFLDLKSIGLPRSLNSVASALTAILGQHGGVASERVFFTCAGVPAAHWAHNGSTFA